MGARSNRYGKLAIAISIMSLVVSAIGTYANWSTASQAAKAADQAVSIASSAYRIANNYPPYVEVISSTPLELRPVYCEPVGSSGNSSCSFKGTFNVNFSIMAPHAGTYNISVVALNGFGPFSPHPVAYLPGEYFSLVKIGNLTISTYPPLQTVTSFRGVVPAAQPFEKTVEVEVSGLTLTAPSGSMRNLNFQGAGTLSAILTYSDIQEPGRNVQRLFIVQVVFLSA